MPRSRTIANNDILEAAIKLVTREGVDKLTFVALGEQVSLSPSTLVQRFGTKRGLMAAAMEYGFRDMEAVLPSTRGQYGSPLETLRTGLVAMAEIVSSVEEFANGQAFFQLGLTDPEVYVRLRASTLSIREEIQQLLDEAVSLSELKPCDTKELALTLQTTYEGAITTWVIYRQGTIEAWMEQRLNAIIEPYKVNKEN